MLDEEHGGLEEVGIPQSGTGQQEVSAECVGHNAGRINRDWAALLGDSRTAVGLVTSDGLANSGERNRFSLGRSPVPQDVSGVIEARFQYIHRWSEGTPALLLAGSESQFSRAVFRLPRPPWRPSSRPAHCLAVIQPQFPTNLQQWLDERHERKPVDGRLLATRDAVNGWTTVDRGVQQPFDSPSRPVGQW